MAKRKGTDRQITINKALHRKNNEEYEFHKHGR
jgi:hypothetical protein